MSSTEKNIPFLKRDGQAQGQRMPGLLDPKLVPVDGRKLKDLFEYIFNISPEIKYYDHTSRQPIVPGLDEGNWQEILNYDQPTFEALWNQLEKLKNKKELPPHFSLLCTFLELYKEPHRLMNNLTGRHLDFYYHEVLGLKRNEPVADKVHIVFELKKNTPPVLLKENDTKFTAGKDKLKKELLYRLTHDIIVNNSKAEQFKSLLVNPSNKNHLHFASIANSADGLGAELDKNNPRWNAFGHSNLSLTSVGFCLASDVLLMKEGDRTITMKLKLSGEVTNVQNNSTFHDLLQVTVTGEKGWTDTKLVSPLISGITDNGVSLSFTFSLTPEDGPVVMYDKKLHGESFNTNKPVVKILFSHNQKYGFNNFKKLNLTEGSIDVNVKGLSDLQIENDFGILNSKKPFQPFGPAPENDANFWLGNNEVFSKQLSKIKLNIEWKNIPKDDLKNYFDGYGVPVDNESFTVNASFKDAGGWIEKNNTQYLFDKIKATKKDEDNFSVHIEFKKGILPQPVRKINLAQEIIPEITIRSSGKTIQQEIQNKSMQFQHISWFNPLQYQFQQLQFVRMIKKIFYYHEANAVLREGYLHLALNHGFLFRQYREMFTRQVLQFSKSSKDSTLDPLNEPFAPEIQRLTLDYTASTGTVSFTDNTLSDYTGTGIELYHAGAFGVMREHSFLRTQSGFLKTKAIKLLPPYYSEGNFFIGLSGLVANDSVCLLFQCAEGSADPELPKANSVWSVLCDNYWKQLTATDFIFDTTNELLTSGVVKLVIPSEATTVNTIMPNGLLWLKISIDKDANSVCQLIEVKANAAIAEFENNDNDPKHLEESMAAGTISKLNTQNGAIKSVSQPYASFGGKMIESEKSFYTRISERLRHKERAISTWDYERLLLQHFPRIYKVNCIPHASRESFAEAGHTLVVVIPDLTNQNAINPFQPGLDKNTLDEIQEFLNMHSTDWATHHVQNPVYEPVHISVSVKLKTGYEFNYYSKELEITLKNYLSPWVNSAVTEIHFGGKITESQIVKLVEDQEYVDYITDLKLFRVIRDDNQYKLIKHFIETSGPASILVSHTRHEIKQS